MTKSTLPHPECPCADLILALLNASSTPLTMHQIRDTIRAGHRHTPTEIRAAVLELVEDELLDWEQLRGAPTRVYFLMHRPPYGAVLIPAGQAPRVAAIAPRPWYAALGMAA